VGVDSVLMNLVEDPYRVSGSVGEYQWWRKSLRCSSPYSQEGYCCDRAGRVGTASSPFETNPRGGVYLFSPVKMFNKMLK